ncbi:MAG: Stage V sporulation protein D [Deltaproteobacteria bacterium ADurb.BinA179]|jgi:penicillin-binding protein 2|nr:penicillin-binding protein 2 [Pseudomonadota bacterium]NLW67752.1 penicillin-binding protein 2 [Bacteriovoracaceae bacterium]OPZ30015.1 MAG: Stage V sporulation protein D [Deltaproteobacteria bacterium ADurb.BinA179]HOD70150.1 penicillin-binding protein 2 [Deltaproteobacteria bacterium]HOE72370.1 penicillin-binding protein 2 [Deltaproteobacteria bacterium]
MNSTNNIPGPHIDDDLKWKAKIFMAFIFCLFTVLLLRLLNMQVFKGSYYEGLARNNRIRIISIPAQRGQILDRNFEVLADNRPAYNLMVMPEDVSDVSSIAGRLAEILECEEAEIIEKIKEGKKRPYNPVALARDISFYQMASIETQLYTMPGVSIDATSERDYVLKELSAHALGFLGEISRRQLEAFGPKSPYAPGDLIGKSGVESICEETLRGTKGVRIFEVDALGRKIHVLDERAPVPGKDVVLTIDKRLQLAACRSLGGRAGAVVAIAPSTGEILAMVSSPSFDPNLFLSPMTPETWKEIIEDPMHPLENRSIRGQYSPGSVFKVLIAALALNSGFVTPDDKVYCPGSYSLGDSTFKCWRKEGHGHVDLATALTQSCDVYFYVLGERLGIDRISSFCQDMGLGRPTGIEFRDELAGLVPTREWKQKRFKEPWQKGESVITAIGQGFTLVTPLQIAKVMSGIVNGGKVITPRILASTQMTQERNLNIRENELAVILEGLKAVVEADRGTGRAIKDPRFTMGGKTGTVQVVRGYTSKLPDQSDLPYKIRDHAWFFGFSPVENPEILVVAIVEHGGSGSAIAAPVVRDVIHEYYVSKGVIDEQVCQDNR